MSDEWVPVVLDLEEAAYEAGGFYVSLRVLNNFYTPTEFWATLGEVFEIERVDPMHAAVCHADLRLVGPQPYIVLLGHEHEKVRTPGGLGADVRSGSVVGACIRERGQPRRSRPRTGRPMIRYSAPNRAPPPRPTIDGGCVASATHRFGLESLMPDPASVSQPVQSIRLRLHL